MRFAIVFPGQGSQSIGMLLALSAAYPVVEGTFNEASEVLGFDLWARCQHGPVEKLNTTQCTQPAMLAAGVAVWRVWQEVNGPKPSMMAGHSLGEYGALVSANAIEFSAAIKVVADRARFMQEAVPVGVGAVAAILGLGDDKVQSACAQSQQGEIAQAVNFNAPGQVVIAGHKGAIERTIETAKGMGARRARLLPLSVPVHSVLMKPAAERFEETLFNAPLRVPEIPVLSNVDIAAYESLQTIRENLAAQLYNPVPWTKTVQKLMTENISVIIESGPGNILTGLHRRIERSLTALGVFDPSSLTSALEAVGNGG